MKMNSIQWVIKISKQCNLRCTYCYEYPFLAERNRIRIEDLNRIFLHIADYFCKSPRKMDFVWHGGEPLLVEPEYYRKIEELQHRVFDSIGIPFTNSVQTNLTILNEEIIDLFKNFFNLVGVSFDLLGDQRINLGGKCTESLVLSNMRRLIDEKVRFSCVTVLSRVTAPHVESIYKFFEAIKTSFRLLPIYRTGYEHQQDRLALSDTEIVSSFKKCVDLWFVSNSRISVQPIKEYLENVLRKLDGRKGPRYYYNKLENERLYIVDTDGSLYSNSDAYDRKLCHGNIFINTLDELKKSEGYLTALKLAHGRMAETCASCRYYGACSGYFMAEATPEQRYVDEQGHLKCGIAKPVQQYIEQILIDAGIVDTIHDTLLIDEIKSKTIEKSLDYFL